MTQTRTGSIGDCFEYDKSGKRLAGFDRMTIDGMVSLSKKWRETYHQYVGTSGYQTWAHAGHEIADTNLPWVEES